MIMEKLQKEHGNPSERIISMRFDSMDYQGIKSMHIADFLLSTEY